MLTTTVQAINSLGIIYFSVTHINYKIESRLIPMHCELLIPPPPPEGGSGKPMGSKTLLKTRLDFLPISKYLVSKILWRAIIFVIKSHLERPEKVSNVPTAFICVLSNSRGL